MTWRLLLFGRSPALAVVLRGLLFGALLVVVSRVAFSPVRAHGISMEPTYAHGHLLLLNRLAYRWSDPVRGDVVAVRLAGGAAVLVKRVVGLPGERVAIRGGTVFVDGRVLEEPYVRKRAQWEVAETMLGPDEFLVIGDNRSMPAELHDFGRATRDRIAGRMVF